MKGSVPCAENAHLGTKSKPLWIELEMLGEYPLLFFCVPVGIAAFKQKTIQTVCRLINGSVQIKKCRGVSNEMAFTFLLPHAENIILT